MRAVGRRTAGAVAACVFIAALVLLNSQGSVNRDGQSTPPTEEPTTASAPRERVLPVDHASTATFLRVMIKRAVVDRVQEDAPFTNKALVDGQLALSKEPLLKPIGAKELQVVFESPCQKIRPVKQIVLCAMARNNAKLVVEWVQWHRIFGVSRFHVFDDESTDDLRAALQPFVAAGIVQVHAAPRPPYHFMAESVRGVDTAVEGKCYDLEDRREKATRQEVWVGALSPREFIAVLPDGPVLDAAGSCLPNILAAAQKTAGPTTFGALVLPMRRVGHTGADVDNFRTQFERTAFAKGDAPPTGPWPERVLVRPQFVREAPRRHQPVGIKFGFEMAYSNGAFRFGHRGVPPVASSNTTFVLQFATTSFRGWLQQKLAGRTDDASIVEPFDIAVEHAAYHKLLHVGFSSLSGPQRRHLDRLNLLLLRALGSPDKPVKPGFAVQAIGLRK